MERRGATPVEWFAAAGGLVLMAGLAVAGTGAIGRARSDASIDAIGAAAFGWGVVALYVVVLLDIIVAWALWRVFRADRPGGAALAAAFRLAYAAAFAAAIAFLADAHRIAAGLDGTGAFDAEARDATVFMRLGEFDTAWSGALLVFAAHLVVIGWLLVRRGGVFAIIVGVLVFVAGAGYAVDSVVRIVTPESDTGVAQFTFIGELVLIAWPVVGGIGSIRAVRRPTGAMREGA
ncbi:DUF4386 family protein [Agromyces sp. Soil535]|uniref:DUF4386 family protein n=1 Tax=Agromyces sp. Soil535 TaxID=1736390 RepID=UPI0006F3F94E|nr:DUF4386 family protein [Agromyces sp. Soil535]KRE21494.1 hypothetical protein ASG80_12750 [Agromyces sp. Soil535]